MKQARWNCGWSFAEKVGEMLGNLPGDVLWNLVCNDLSGVPLRDFLSFRRLFPQGLAHRMDRIQVHRARFRNGRLRLARQFFCTDRRFQLRFFRLSVFRCLFTMDFWNHLDEPVQSRPMGLGETVRMRRESLE